MRARLRFVHPDCDRRKLARTPAELLIEKSSDDPIRLDRLRHRSRPRRPESVRQPFEHDELCGNTGLPKRTMKLRGTTQQKIPRAGQEQCRRQTFEISEYRRQKRIPRIDVLVVALQSARRTLRSGRAAQAPGSPARHHGQQRATVKASRSV